MSDSNSYTQAEQTVQDHYQELLAAGKVTPASSLIGSANFFILVGWLLACGSLSDTTFRRARVPVFTAIALSSVWNLLYVRSIGVVGSIGVGLNSVLCTILASNFILIHDPRSFKRLVLRPSAGAHAAQERADLCARVNGDHERDAGHALTWQSMPQTFWWRLVWVFDLMTSFRHVHWMWDPSKSLSLTAGLQRLISLNACRSDSLMRNSTRFLTDYLMIDLIKCIMIADPYFVGTVTPLLPPHITPYITSPWGLYTYRTLLAAAGVWVAIDLIFSFTVLIQVNLLGQSVIGLNGLSVSFPPLWGSLSAVPRRGLRGFWGETWHQIFRMHFLSLGDATANILLSRVASATRSVSDHGETPSHYPGHSTAKSMIRVVVAFLLSGVVHACASFTLLGPTAPWKPFVFFAIQPLGIVLQERCWSLSTRGSVLRLCLLSKTTVLKITNCFFTAGWLWACSGMFLDDVTSGGIWMFEPIPMSLIRGLGFSGVDDRFWCW